MKYDEKYLSMIEHMASLSRRYTSDRDKQDALVEDLWIELEEV